MRQKGEGNWKIFVRLTRSRWRQVVRQQWSLNGQESRRTVKEKNEGKGAIPVEGRVSREKSVMRVGCRLILHLSLRDQYWRGISPKACGLSDSDDCASILRRLPIGAFFEQGDLECPLNFGLDIDQFYQCLSKVILLSKPGKMYLNTKIIQVILIKHYSANP